MSIWFRGLKTNKPKMYSQAMVDYTLQEDGIIKEQKQSIAPNQYLFVH